MCIIVENESDVAAFKDYKDDSQPAQTTSKPAPAPAAAAPAAAPPPPPPPAFTPSPVTPAVSGGSRVYASPLAKRLAAEKGLSLEVR